MNEAVRALGAKEVSDLIGEHITAFLDGGPDRETEDVELAGKAGLKVERIIARWADAREYLLFILPATQPRVEESPQPQHDAKADVGGWGKRRSLREEEEARLEQPSAAKADAKAEEAPKEDHFDTTEPEVEAQPTPLVHTGIDMDAPYEIARRFLFDRYSLEGVATLRWWNAEWRKWTGTHYAAMEEDALRAEIYQFLAKANYGKFDPAFTCLDAGSNYP